MNEDLSQSLTTISQLGQLIPEILKADDKNERSAQLAAALRKLWPRCGLSACLLDGNGQSFGSALDVNGNARDDWRDCLVGVLRSPPNERPAAMPAGIALPGHDLAMEWVALRDRRIGLCALAIPTQMHPAIRSVARTFLPEFALLLGLHLQAEAMERIQERMSEDLAALSWMANLGELAGPLIHQFNNFLNVSMLNVILLERQLDSSFRPDLESVRRQGAETAALVRHLQQNREKERPSPYAVDLNEVVGEMMGRSAAVPVRIAINSGEARVRFEPAALPVVFGSAADLKRLLQFLLSQSAAASGGDVDICIRTGVTADHVWLRFEDSGPAVDPELLPHLFESQMACRQGTDQLKLAACKSLVRRLRGEIHAENRDNSGLAITVVLPISEPEVA